MPTLRDRLAQPPDPTITVLPDGSVDYRSDVRNPAGHHLTRQELGTAITNGAKTFRTADHGVEPGGQAVNAARQLAALDVETTLIGHLDDPIFESLSVRRFSMGAPTTVQVYELDDGVVMVSNESQDIKTWTPQRLYQTIGPDIASVFAVDAVVWLNWAAFPHGTAALEELLPECSNLVVFDPGAVPMRSTAEQRALIEMFQTSDNGTNVILSPNRTETQLLAQAIGLPETDLPTTAEQLRTTVGFRAVVIHDSHTAIAATNSGTYEVPVTQVSEPVRHAGAGDRFTAALAYGRTAGWDWPVTLRLGNAVAGHYLLHGRSGDRRDLINFLAE